MLDDPLAVMQLFPTVLRDIKHVNILMKSTTALKLTILIK